MSETKTSPLDDFTPYADRIALDRLILSGLNVRRTERDADVASLAEDIAARGLKQNLVVVPAHFTTSTVDEPWNGEDRWAGKFEVIAGGRRLQAMQLLLADGRLTPDHPVPCLVEPRSEATETSLSENLHRVAMNPADEFEAFRDICDQRLKLGEGETPAVAYTAKRFGVTVPHVQGRLRLAALAPEILEALRKNAITLDSAKAYAGSADRELQIKVFLDQCKPGVWKPHDPKSVRDALRQITLPLDSALVNYVGLEAFRAAGGRTEVEMFMGTEGEERILDVKLLGDLAHAKAEKAVAAWKKKEGWKDVLLARGVSHMAKIPKIPADFEKSWDYVHLITKAERKNRIVAIAINSEGSGFMPLASYKAKVEAEPRQAYRQETPEERAARRRAEGTALWRARLAVGEFAGTPLAGKALWPVFNEWNANITFLDTAENQCEPQNGEDWAFADIDIVLRIPKADFDKISEAEAAARYDADKADHDRRREEQNAQLDRAEAKAEGECQPEDEDQPEETDEDAENGE